MTVRIGVIGCGAIARRAHLPALRAAGAEITTFASRSRSSAEAAQGECEGAGVITDDWRDLVASDDVDAVTICTPNAFHAEMTIAAAQAGKHVLVEKPIACSLADADAMLAAAGDAGVVLMPAQNLRFNAPFVAARDAIARGDIGAITGVRAAFGHGGPAAWAPDATWFFDAELAGGGALIDLGIHLADLVRAVTGDDVVEVAGMLYGDGAVEDTGVAVLRFAGGAVGSMQSSWISKAGLDIQLSIFGTEGTLHLDGGTPLTQRPAAGKPHEVEMPTDVPNLDAAFVEAVATGAPLPVSAADGRAALANIAAGYRSARSGETVKVL
jgi:predicted dehydrogenase